MSSPITFPINLPDAAKKNLGQQIAFQAPFYLAMPFYGYKAFSCTPGEGGGLPDVKVKTISVPGKDEKLRLIDPASSTSTAFVSFGTAKEIAMELFLYSNNTQKDYIGTRETPLDGTLYVPAALNKDLSKWTLYSLEYPDDDRPLCFGDLIVLKNKATQQLLSATDTTANPPKANAAAAGYNEIWMILSA